MPTPIDTLRAEFVAALGAAGTESDLKALRDQYLGRKGGALAGLMKAVAGALADERPVLGRLANELKQEIEAAIDAKRDALASSRPPAGAVDVTLPGRPRPRPPASADAVCTRIEAIFARQGYEIIDGPETEDDWHNFEGS